LYLTFAIEKEILCKVLYIKVKLDDIWLGIMNRACLVLVCMIVLASTFFINLQITNATEENTWQTLQPLPQPMSGPAVTVDDKIYIFHNNVHLFEYDPQRQTLTQKPSMPTQRNNYGLAVVDNKIYIIGGQGSIAPNEVYDTRTATWTTKQPAPDSLEAKGGRLYANAVNNKIYILYSNSTSDSTWNLKHQPIMIIYDTESDNWTMETAPPTEIFGTEARLYTCAIDNKIFVLQDREGGQMYVYDVKTGNWSTLASPSTVYERSRMVATTGRYAPKQIYLIGGAIEHGFADYEGVGVVFMYDLASDSWSRAADMPTARYDAAVAVIDDKIYALGGATGLSPNEGWIANATSAIEVLTPFGYGSRSGLAGSLAVFGGVAVVVLVLAVSAVVVLHFRHSPVKAVKPS
jgi:N-acetylneuraminic acid mutarotase